MRWVTDNITTWETRNTQNKINLRMGYTLLTMTAIAIISVLSLIYGIMMRFGSVNISSFGYSYLIMSFLITLVLTLGFQYLISPFILDWALKRLFSSKIFKYNDFLNEENLPLWFRQHVQSQVESSGIGLKKIFILDDFTMNAFVYGHGHWNGRLAVTKGMFRYLSEDEFKAVVGHEITHIKNNDFIFITLASGIPLFSAYAYSFFRGLIRDTAKRPQSWFLVPIYIGGAAVNYFLYIVSYLLFLSLTRAREAMADLGSVERGHHPHHLSYALMKIGYGTLDISPPLDYSELSNLFPDITEVVNESEINEYEEDKKKAKPRGNETTTVISAMGFSSTPTNVNYAYSNAGSDIRQRINKPLNFERKHPMGKFLRVFQSHPLISDRLKMMDELAMSRGDTPLLDITEGPTFAQTVFGKHQIDFMYMILNYIPLFLLPAIPFYIYEFGSISYRTLLFAESLVFAILGVYFVALYRMRYPSNYKPYTPVEIVEADKGHPLFDVGFNRRKPVEITGTVLGRLTPGFILGDDFIVNYKQDGYDQNMVVLWQSATSFLGDIIFALKHLPKIEHKQVTIKGWLSRVPQPVLIAKEISYTQGISNPKRIKTWINVASNLFAWGLFIISAVLFFLSI